MKKLNLFQIFELESVVVNVHQHSFVWVALQGLLQEARQIHVLIFLQDVAFIWIQALLQQERETMSYRCSVRVEPEKFPQDFVWQEPTRVACLLENLTCHIGVKLPTSLYILHEFVICVQKFVSIVSEHF